MITGVDVVFVHTSSPELAEWYQAVLGMPKGYGDGHWQEFLMHTGSRFGIDLTGYPRSVVEKQSVMISFSVEDIHGMVHELAEKGVQFYPSTETTIFDVGPALVATFCDPDGNWIQISQRKQNS